MKEKKSDDNLQCDILSLVLIFFRFVNFSN